MVSDVNPHPYTEADLKRSEMDKVGRRKLDPGLKAPRFQKINLMKIKVLST